MLFKSFSVLIFSMLNIDRYNLHKQKLFGSATIFKSVQGPETHRLRTTDPVQLSDFRAEEMGSEGPDLLSHRVRHWNRPSGTD